MILTDADYKRIASTLHGPCLKGFEQEHRRRGGTIPYTAKRSDDTYRPVQSGDIFEMFGDVFGGGR